MNDGLATMRIRCGIDEMMRMRRDRDRDSYGRGWSSGVGRWGNARDADDDLVGERIHPSIKLQRTE